MVLTLCSNCRLPMNANAARCHLCGAERPPTLAERSRVPIAAALAVVATLALMARRLA